MRGYWFMLSVLCVWRVTHLLQAEDGPWDVLVRLRRMAGSGFLGKLLDCFYCLSLWVAAPLAYWIAETRLERLLWWPALSAGAILLERVTSPRSGDAPANYLEDGNFENRDLKDEEKPHVLLRTEENTRARDT
ncbi:MAG TPA: DUF1360 domain-containing protein [Candidatus Dormibacteraeota bacterium]|nr:DUF1360 domain-containing protein [Candidatus Dormibacteraeota bacterium]